MPESPPGLELVDPTTDALLKMTVGARLVVRLAENPTTGYRWRHTLTEHGVVEWLEDEYAADSDRRGSGGRRSITFRALHAGSTAIQFTLRRSWESNPPLKSLRIYVDVLGSS
jgi:inhibitor of cysteine peptidase